MPENAPMLGAGTPAPMTLQGYLAAFANFLEGYVIPFILLLAFVAFLINVIRYFILGGGSDESRATARVYIIWSILGFIVTLALWGIVNLLLITFGVSSYGGIVCPDYDPTCSASGISAPTTFSDPIGGFTGVPPPAGTAPDIPTTVAGSPDYTPPGFPAPLSPDTAPSIPGTTSGDYSNIADNAINEVIVRYEPDSTFLSDQLALIEQPGIDDYSRIAIANAYADAGIISPLAVNQVVASINEVRTGAGESALSVTSVQQVPSLPVYTADAASYDAAMAEAELVFTTWYGGDETSAILAFDRIFNTSEYSYGERLDNAEEQILSMNSPDLELNDTLANIVDTAFSIESYYPNGPL